MVMGCEEVCEAVRLGDESQDILEHLAHCASCRTKAQSTQFVGGGATEKRRPAALARGRLPWLIAVALAPLCGALAVAAVMSSRQAQPAVEEPRRKSPAKVTPIAAPVPTPSPEDGLRRLWVDSDPVAVVFIDGQRLGSTPYRGVAAPGRVVVEVRAAGFRTGHKVVLVGDQDPPPIAFLLDPVGAIGRTGGGAPRDSDGPGSESPPPVRAEKPASPAAIEKEMPEAIAKPAAVEKPKEEAIAKPPPVESDTPVVSGFGYLSITTDPWAKVILDGKDIGRTTPLHRFSTTAGHHTVELRARTGTVTVEVNVKPKQELEVDKTIE